jgi:hypothetical protein
MMADSSTASWTSFGLGAAFSLLNWVYVYLSWRTGRSHSLIPLIGGVCLLIGALLVPSLHPFAWVPGRPGRPVCTRQIVLEERALGIMLGR